MDFAWNEQDGDMADQAFAGVWEDDDALDADGAFNDVRWGNLLLDLDHRPASATSASDTTTPRQNPPNTLDQHAPASTHFPQSHSHADAYLPPRRRSTLYDRPPTPRARPAQLTASHPPLPPINHHRSFSPDYRVTGHPRQFGFGYTFDDAPPPSDHPSPASSYDDFVTLGDSDSEQEQEQEPRTDMPPATRNRAANRRSSVVDLTSGSSPPGADDEPLAKRSLKRRGSALSSGRASKRGTGASSSTKIEEVDLSHEAPSADEELLQQQQQETIKAQQAAEDDQRPQRIGQRQCIICMENYTNATVTACGHFYCHECLVQALMAGEKSNDRTTGTCPVCRKQLSRKKKHDIIPIQFMTKDQFAQNQRKRAEIH